MTDKMKTSYVAMDIPLFIRLLEYSREEAKTDMDLHVVAEKCLALGWRILTMKDYKKIVPK